MISGALSLVDALVYFTAYISDRGCQWLAAHTECASIAG